MRPSAVAPPAVPLQVGCSLKEWVDAPSIEPYRKIDGRKFVAAALGRLLERYSPTPAAREDYLILRRRAIRRVDALRA